MSLPYYRGDDPKNQPSLNDRIDAAMRRAAGTFRGDREESGGYILCDQLRQNSVSQLENDHRQNPANQTFRQSLVQGIRQANALKEQAEHYRQFGLKADLIFVDKMTEQGEKRFRERRSRLNKGRFDLVWSREVCHSQDHPHFHVLIRLRQTDDLNQGIKDFRSYIADVLSHRKGQPPTIEYNLNVQSIDQSGFDHLSDYNCKAKSSDLTKIKPPKKGQRRFSASRGAFDMPARQLHRQRWQRHVIASDPARLEYVCEADWDAARATPPPAGQQLLSGHRPDDPQPKARTIPLDGPDAICQTDPYAAYRRGLVSGKAEIW